MATREMIVAGFTGPRAEEEVDPFLRPLLGQFMDEMSKTDEKLWEYASSKGLPDLYFAFYDTETFALYCSEGDGRGTSVSFGYEPKTPKQWERLRLTLSTALQLGMEID